MTVKEDTECSRALFAALAAVAVRDRGVGACGRSRADHDRLGVRREGRTWRRSTARRWPRPRSASSRSTPRAASTGASSRSSPATRRATTPAKAKSCAAGLIGQGADIMFVTCDVDFATPVVRRRSTRGMLAVAPCIGTDQMGPKRFGAKGKLAFSFGNVAQDEGAAMAEYAYKRRAGRRRRLATNNAARLLQERRPGVREPLHAARRQDRRRRRATRRAQNDVGNAVTPAQRRQGRRDRDVDRRSASCRRSSSGLRSLGNNTPILNSWAGDGTYWVHEEPEGDELLRRHLRLDRSATTRTRPSTRSPRQVKAGHRRLRHGRGGDRRRRRRDQAGRGIDERRRARRADGEVQEGADDLGARSASRRSCTRCSAASTA